MEDRKRTPEELKALKLRARKWAETEGPAAIKRAIEVAEKDDQRMKAAQASPLHGDIIRRYK